ncbi:MAG: hypothetical protein ACRC57_00825 [Sarcina sp.]
MIKTDANTRVKELSIMAKELINEFICSMDFLGWEPIEKISVGEKFDKIILKVFGEETEEIAIEKLTEEFSAAMQGFGPCSFSFYEGIELCISKISDEYKKVKFKENLSLEDFEVSRKDAIEENKKFKEYIGNLYYIRYRGEEIYSMLKDIEDEYISLVE